MIFVSKDPPAGPSCPFPRPQGVGCECRLVCFLLDWLFPLEQGPAPSFSPRSAAFADVPPLLAVGRALPKGVFYLECHVPGRMLPFCINCPFVPPPVLHISFLPFLMTPGN